MRPYEDIRRAMKCCVIGPIADLPDCSACPYNTDPQCHKSLRQDIAEMLRSQRHDIIRLSAVVGGKNV
jgi:hypothetical protein